MGSISLVVLFSTLALLIRDIMNDLNKEKIIFPMVYDNKFPYPVDSFVNRLFLLVIIVLNS